MTDDQTNILKKLSLQILIEESNTKWCRRP